MIMGAENVPYLMEVQHRGQTHRHNVKQYNSLRAEFEKQVLNITKTSC